MSKCACIEPAPTRFSAPTGLFSGADLKRIGAVWLGATIVSPGCGFSYQVASGPLCRLYWNNGKPEPHSFESAYYQDEKRRWQRWHCNYLSYLLTNGEYLTVRWQSPMECASAPGNKLQKAA